MMTEKDETEIGETDGAVLVDGYVYGVGYPCRYCDSDAEYVVTWEKMGERQHKPVCPKHKDVMMKRKNDATVLSIGVEDE